MLYKKHRYLICAADILETLRLGNGNSNAKLKRKKITADASNELYTSPDLKTTPLQPFGRCLKT